MSLKNILRSAKFIVPAAIGLWSGTNAFSQTQDQVQLQGVVRDTSGHVVENANIKMWKADDPTILELTETDFNGEYTQDISTPVEEIPFEEPELTVINSGNSRHVGFVGTLPEKPSQIQIINSIGQFVANIPFDYESSSKIIQADWRADKPGIYIANIVMPTQRETLKFVATGNDIPPILSYSRLSEQASTKKSLQGIKGGALDPIKYYIEISADGNEPINFATIKDSISVEAGQIGYPEHVIAPILESYSAPVIGHVTIGGNPVGENFKIVLTPESGSAQELFTDADGNFSTTFTIPYQSFPYDPATLNLDGSAEPTATSIQTTNGNNSVAITDSETPFTLDMAVDSAYVSLFGNVAQTDVTGTITVDGKEVYSGPVSDAYDINNIKTIKSTVPVEYAFTKYHYEDATANQNVAVWSDNEFNPTLTFIQAEYTGNTTIDAGADITITKNEGGETLWDFVSTGADALPTLNRNELDSILVDLNATLTNKQDFDTAFYMRELLPNNIELTMKDIPKADYTMNVTSDNGANITIVKDGTSETLWQYTSTGTNNLPTIQRNEQDSILVDLNATLTNKQDFDTTFYMRELLPNNIAFTMDDVVNNPDYVRAYGIIQSTNGSNITGHNLEVILTREDKPTETYSDFSEGATSYDFEATIPVYTSPEGYTMTIIPPDGIGLMETTHNFDYTASPTNQQHDVVCDSLPHAKYQGTIRNGDDISEKLDGVTVQFVNKANDVVLDTDVTDANGYYKSNIALDPGTEIYLLIGGKEGFLARGGTFTDWTKTVTQPMFATDTLQTYNWTLPQEVGTYGTGVDDTITVSALDIADMVYLNNIEHAMGRPALFNYEQFIADSPSATSATVNGWINDFKTAFPNANIVRTTSDYVLTTEDKQNYDYQTNFHPDSVITHVNLGINQTFNEFTTINGELQILYSLVTLSGNQVGFNKETGRSLGLGETAYAGFMSNSGSAITKRDKRAATLILRQGQYQYKDELDSFSYKNLRENE